MGWTKVNLRLRITEKRHKRWTVKVKVNRDFGLEKGDIGGGL